VEIFKIYHSTPPQIEHYDHFAAFDVLKRINTIIIDLVEPDSFGPMNLGSIKMVKQEKLL
jgi:hypothetical protein